MLCMLVLSVPMSGWISSRSRSKLCTFGAEVHRVPGGKTWSNFVHLCPVSCWLHDLWMIYVCCDCVQGESSLLRRSGYKTPRLAWHEWCPRGTGKRWKKRKGTMGKPTQNDGKNDGEKTFFVDLEAPSAPSLPPEDAPTPPAAMRLPPPPPRYHQPNQGYQQVPQKTVPQAQAQQAQQAQAQAQAQALQALQAQQHYMQVQQMQQMQMQTPHGQAQAQAQAQHMHLQRIAAQQAQAQQAQAALRLAQAQEDEYKLQILTGLGPVRQVSLPMHELERGAVFAAQIQKGKSRWTTYARIFLCLWLHWIHQEKWPRRAAWSSLLALASSSRNSFAMLEDCCMDFGAGNLTPIQGGRSDW